MTRFRRFLTCTLGLAVAALWVGVSSSQGLGPVGSFGGASRGPSRPEYSRSRGRPTVSPYLNLFRADGTSALNYYNLVRPQVDQYRGQQMQSYEIGRLEQQIGVLEANAAAGGRRSASPVRATGHPSAFFNYSHYFPGSAGGYATGTAGP